jgi:hypothetical protein
MKYTIIILLLGFVLKSDLLSGKGPGWSGEKQYTFLKEWSFGLNTGVTSYYGDLSLHDRNYFNKVRYESKPAVGIIVTKHLNNTFAVASQVIYGGFRCDFSPELAFNTRLLEYNIQGRVDLFELMVPDNPFRLKGIAFAGLGQFIFNVSGPDGAGSDFNGTVHNTRVPEFVIFFGGGLSYEINYRFRITAELALRQAQNDRLDNFVHGNNFDYYNALLVGITYYVPTFVKKGNVANLLRNESMKSRP